jgi:hypothetical protein
MSEHKTIAAALAAAQMNMGKALKQSQNPHFRSKYADLGNVMDACLPALNAEGIAVIQPVQSDGMGGREVVTRFIHPCGETLDCPVPLIIGKNDMQGLGSALTYARRYGLMALAGIAPEDDDGNAAVASTQMAPREKSWAETVMDHAGLGPDAPSHEKATALADAICGEFKRKSTMRQLDNEWERRKALIDRFEADFPDLHAQVAAGYEAQQTAVTGGE